MAGHPRSRAVCHTPRWLRRQPTAPSVRRSRSCAAARHMVKYRRRESQKNPHEDTPTRTDLSWDHKRRTYFTSGGGQRPAAGRRVEISAPCRCPGRHRRGAPSASLRALHGAPYASKARHIAAGAVRPVALAAIPGWDACRPAAARGAAGGPVASEMMASSSLCVSPCFLIAERHHASAAAAASTSPKPLAYRTLRARLHALARARPGHRARQRRRRRAARAAGSWRAAASIRARAHARHAAATATGRPHPCGLICERARARRRRRRSMRSTRMLAADPAARARAGVAEEGRGAEAAERRASSMRAGGLPSSGRASASMTRSTSSCDEAANPSLHSFVAVSSTRRQGKSSSQRLA